MYGGRKRRVGRGTIVDDVCGPGGFAVGFVRSRGGGDDRVESGEFRELDSCNTTVMSSMNSNTSGHIAAERTNTHRIAPQRTLRQ